MPRRPSISSFRAFSLDPASPEPLHRQLYDELRRAILAGRLTSGSRLPASRELASVTRVSRNTVLSAYDQLLAEGYIQSRAGSGTYVADAIPESLVPESAPEAPVLQPGSRPRTLSRRGMRIAETVFVKQELQPIANAFRPGLPALDHFPMDIWRRLTDRRLRRASVRMLSYDDPQGYLPLREAIATHLSAARGARCGPEHILIVNGSQQAIDVVTRVLLDEGDSAWMESPGYFAARAAFRAAGVRVVPVPVDEDGMDVAEGIRRAPDARLAYCTPSHQNPLGVTLSLPRRMALMQWAAANGSWVMEDDNASEYRFEGRPLAALQGIDTSGRVLYAGTFSKVLFSSLRLGYLVAPTDVVGALVRARELTDRQTPGLAQAVVADFMNEGHFARHIRRMRTLYASRLDALRSAIREHASDVLQMQESQGGMSRVVRLPADVDDARAAARLLRSGLQALPLSEYSMGEPVPPAFVLGFTGVDETEIESGVRKMAETLREHIRESRQP
ncbi:MAG: PLP-dependent aminotransferase family protein [Candidatus Eisenbacteria bacterium]|nr:PLP-dependent aminotransferase family protein [Candidatus Eisenbacteria bacterium]